MEDITLTALKSLYRTELKELELMQEYAAEKETTLYSLAVDILREVGRKKSGGRHIRFHLKGTKYWKKEAMPISKEVKI